MWIFGWTETERNLHRHYDHIGFVILRLKSVESFMNSVHTNLQQTILLMIPTFKLQEMR